MTFQHFNVKKVLYFIILKNVKHGLNPVRWWGRERRTWPNIPRINISNMTSSINISTCVTSDKALILVVLSWIQQLPCSQAVKRPHCKKRTVCSLTECYVLGWTTYSQRWLLCKLMVMSRIQELCNWDEDFVLNIMNKITISHFFYISVFLRVMQACESEVLSEIKKCWKGDFVSPLCSWHFPAMIVAMERNGSKL